MAHCPFCLAKLEWLAEEGLTNQDNDFNEQAERWACHICKTVVWTMPLNDYHEALCAQRPELCEDEDEEDEYGD